MDIFSVITLLGGLAFFLYGMNVMSSGLEKLAGGKLEIVLKKMTSNKFKSLLLGMGITIDDCIFEEPYEQELRQYLLVFAGEKI